MNRPQAFLIGLPKWLLLLALLSCGLAWGQGPQVTLQDLDAILDKAPDAVTFMNSPELLNEYYQLAAVYYGGTAKFQRSAFDAVTLDAKALFAAIPETAVRAWEVRATRPPLTLRSALKPYPVKFKPGKSKLLLEQIGLSETQLDSPQPTLSEVQQSLQDLKIKTEQIFTEAGALSSGRARQKKITLDLAQLKENETTKRLRSQLLQMIVADPVIQAELQSDHADLELARIEGIRSSPEKFLPQFLQYQNQLNFLFGSIPQTGTLIGNNEIFEPLSTEMASSVYSFVDVKRIFHALYRGICSNECVGGWAEQLQMLTPSRYAIPLLHDGFEIQVLRDGIYAGYLSESLRAFKDKKYFNLDILSRAMTNTIVIGQGHHGTDAFRKVNLLDAWLIQEYKRLPSGVDGLMIGMGHSLNNANGNWASRKSEAWMNSIEIGPARELKSIDPLAVQLLAIPKPSSLNQNYNSQDSFIDETGTNISMVAAKLIPGEFDFKQLNSPQWITAQFSSSVFVEAKLWLTLFYRKAEQTEVKSALQRESWEILQSYADKSRANHPAALEFAERCSTYCWISIFRAAIPTLNNNGEAFKNALAWVEVIPQQFRADLSADVIHRHLDELSKLIFANKKPLEYYGEIQSSLRWVNDLMKLMEVMSSKSSTAAEYLSFVDPGRSPIREYRVQIDALILRQIDVFSALHPTIAQWMELSERTFYVTARSKVLDAALTSIRNIKDYRRLAEFDSTGSNSEIRNNFNQSTLKHWSVLTAVAENADEYIALVAAMTAKMNAQDRASAAKNIVQQIDFIQSLHPQPRQWQALTPFANTVTQYVGFLEAGVVSVRSAKDFVILVKYGPNFSPTAAMKKAMDRFIDDHFTEFLAVYPSAEAIQTILEMLTDLKLKEKLTSQSASRKKLSIYGYCARALSFKSVQHP